MVKRVFGEKIIEKSLRKELNKIDGDISKGLQLGLKHIEGEAVLKAPIEFGVLRNSSFSGIKKTGKKILGRVGFIAKYAPWVHEMPGKLMGQPRSSGKGVYWQGGEPKFLDKAVKEGLPVLLSLVKKFAKR